MMIYHVARYSEMRIYKSKLFLYPPIYLIFRPEKKRTNMGTIESKDNNNCTINSFETAFITYGNFIISKYDSGNLNHQHGIAMLHENVNFLRIALLNMEKFRTIQTLPFDAEGIKRANLIWNVLLKNLLNYISTEFCVFCQADAHDQPCSQLRVEPNLGKLNAFRCYVLINYKS